MTLIVIAFVLLLSIVFLLFILFKSINNKSYIADDGSVFKNQSDQLVYQDLYEKTKPLFSADVEKGSSQEILGFEKAFITKLTSEGFQDLRTLVKYRNQIKSLSDLINT